MFQLEKKKFFDDYLNDEIKSENLKLQEYKNKLKNPPSTDHLSRIERWRNDPKNLPIFIRGTESRLKSLEYGLKQIKEAFSNNNSEPFNVIEDFSYYLPGRYIPYDVEGHIKLDVSKLDIDQENSETLKPYNFIISVTNDIKTPDKLTEHINNVVSKINKIKDKNAKIAIFTRNPDESTYHKYTVEKDYPKVYRFEANRLISPNFIAEGIAKIYYDKYREKDSTYEFIESIGVVTAGSVAILGVAAGAYYGMYKLCNKYIKPKVETAKNIIHKS